MADSSNRKQIRRSLRRARFVDHFPGIFLTVLLILLALGFVGLLVLTNLLPLTYIAAILVALMVLILLDYLLMIHFRRPIRFFFGALLAIALGAGLATGSFYLFKSYSTLKDITETKVNVAQIHVFVAAEDPAESLEDTVGYNFGILSQLDRKTTDGAVEELKKSLGEDLVTVEFEGLSDMADGLRKNRCQAILLNGAYLDVLSEMKGYEDFAGEIKLIHSIDIESLVVEEEKTYTSKPLEQVTNVKADKDAELSDVYTILISGIDTRGAMTARSLSDVNIIATINSNTHQILMISTPRDYFVPLSISNGIPDKLTHAGIYGVEVVEATQEMLYDIDIDYYFRINFGGFVKIIDTLGGIDVYSDYDFTASDYYHYVVGENHLNGEEALAFCRERYSFSDGDRQRGRNQMKVVQSVANKVLSPDLLPNYLSLLDTTKDCFDTNIPYNIISDLVKNQLKDNASWAFFTYSTTGFDDNQKPYSMSQHAYVMQPDYNTVEKAKDLMSRVRANEVMTQDKIEEEFHAEG